MQIQNEAIAIPVLAPHSGGYVSRWASRATRFARQKPLGAVSACIIAVIVLAAIFAPVIAPYGYAEKAGAQLSAPSRSHLMGTDRQSRDSFSRIIYGARATVKIGLGAAALGTLTALVIGMTSGFIGGWYDALLQRLIDTFMSLPGIVIVLSVVAFAGGDTVTIILVLGFLAAPGMSRVIRGATIAVRDAPYIEAARAVSATTPRLMLRHTLPNIVAPTVVVGTLAVGNAILAEAALSFLGFGVTPPTPSWGQALSVDRQYLQIAPWLAIFPGLAITVTVFSFNMLGDALRDVLDPRLRNT
ncbi:MAG: ABC transporter permease [Chloroflexi bacterium]|nr:ABC transporter permease [Chloroflexota bacterium]